MKTFTATATTAISPLRRKVVTARKARVDRVGRAINPGDRVRETTYFKYEVGGKRIGYVHVYDLIEAAA